MGFKYSVPLSDRKSDHSEYSDYFKSHVKRNNVNKIKGKTIKMRKGPEIDSVTRSGNYGRFNKTGDRRIDTDWYYRRYRWVDNLVEDEYSEYAEFKRQEDLINSINERFEEAERYSKQLVTVFGALLAGSAGLIKLTKNAKTKKQVKKITNEVRQIQKDLKSGKISEDEASAKSRICEDELRKILKTEKKFLKEQAKIKKKLEKENKKSVKESVLLEIYESERNGDITEEERDMLLEMMG